MRRRLRGRACDAIGGRGGGSTALIRGRNVQFRSAGQAFGSSTAIFAGAAAGKGRAAELLKPVV